MGAGQKSVVITGCSVGAGRAAAFRMARAGWQVFAAVRKPEDAIVGRIGVEGLVDEIARIERGEGTVSGLTKAVETTKPGSEEAIEARWKLAGKLADLGQSDRHDAILVTIRE